MPTIQNFNSLPDWMKRRMKIQCPICGEWVGIYGKFPRHMQLTHPRNKPVSDEDNKRIPHYAEVDDDRKLFLKYTRKQQETPKRYNGEIKFKLTFKEYVQLIYDAGIKSSQIGVYKGQYVLGRYGDMGDYELGNCRFITREQNNEEMLQNIYPSSKLDHPVLDSENTHRHYKFSEEKPVEVPEIIFDVDKYGDTIEDAFYNLDPTTYKKCSICGKKLTRTTPHHDDICDECYNNPVIKANLKQRKVKRPSRDELKFKLRHFPMIYIGKHYGVSDNAVKKWCKKYNLPSARFVRVMSEEEFNKL